MSSANSVCGSGIGKPSCWIHQYAATPKMKYSPVAVTNACGVAMLKIPGSSNSATDSSTAPQPAR